MSRIPKLLVQISDGSGQLFFALFNLFLHIPHARSRDLLSQLLVNLAALDCYLARRCLDCRR